MPNAIFIVGTGRSGTHFLARTMGGFANIWDPRKGAEHKGVLYEIARKAMYSRPLTRRVVRYYNDHFAKKPHGGVFLDQHHPLIFHTEKMARLHDGALFVHPVRPVEQVVASMMTHSGVMDWYDFARARQETDHPLPFPNPFLGLTSYQQLISEPIHMLCARRVIAHERAWAAVRDNAHCRTVDYTALIHDTEAELARVFKDSELKRLGRFEAVETPRPASLMKYKKVLDKAQVRDVRKLWEAEMGG